jgi:hypothetical protein
MDVLLVQTVLRDGNFSSRSLSILLEDEGHYNRLRQKAVQEAYIAGVANYTSFGRRTLGGNSQQEPCIRH